MITFAIYSLGLLVASVSGTIKTANLLSSIVYFPMFFLSGATVPYEIMPKGLQAFSNIMPHTHRIKLLKAVSLDLPIENVIISITFLCITGIVCTLVSIKTFRWE